MHPLRMSLARMLASLRESRSADGLGAAGVALGIILVALGWILEEASIGIGSAIRTLGGISFLAGLATVVFGDSRRRAVAIGMSKRVVARYMSRTAYWGWPDRVGLAGVIVGLALSVPAVVLQIIFRNGGAVAGAGRHTLLGWNRPSHIRQISRSRREADQGPAFIGFSYKGTRRRAPVAPTPGGLAYEPSQSWQKIVMKPQGTGAAATASFKRAGPAYKAGLVVILAGVVVFASSWLLGGVVFAAVMDLLALLDAPDDRQFLPADQPEAGGQILQHLGGTLIACGVCIATIRLVAELLGLAGRAGIDWQAGPGRQAGFGRGGHRNSHDRLDWTLAEHTLRGLPLRLWARRGHGHAGDGWAGRCCVLDRRTCRSHSQETQVSQGAARLGGQGGMGQDGCGRINKLGLGAIVLALIWRSSDARVRERIRHSSRSRDWHSCCGNRSPHSCGRAALERGELSSSRRESASAES